eukprot:GEZU01013951.1.p2 GENE.GEZU01013951.1~~GEZU01013951.1.p2  ORF type:complete len:107 (+),score=12.82 GEZU01013951.1:67-387(+)
MSRHRSGALVFSSAIIEFNKKKGVKKSLDLCNGFSDEFDIVIIEANEFLEKSAYLSSSRHKALNNRGSRISADSGESSITDSASATGSEGSSSRQPQVTLPDCTIQ